MDQYLKSPHCLKLHELYLQQKFSSGFQVRDASLFTLFTLNPIKCNKGVQVPKHFPDEGRINVQLEWIDPGSTVIRFLKLLSG